MPYDGRMDRTRRDGVDPFITRDGSTIRELAGPATNGARYQSLAEATLPPGRETIAHYHPVAEELYYVVAGSGRLRVHTDEQDVEPGDCVVIPPGQPHKLWNTSSAEDLVILCCCAPPYAHEDTVLLEDVPAAAEPAP